MAPSTVMVGEQVYPSKESALRPMAQTPGHLCLTVFSWNHGLQAKPRGRPRSRRL